MNPRSRVQARPWLGVVLLSSVLAACGGGGGDDPSPGQRADAAHASGFDAGNLAGTLASYPMLPPSTAEADSLSFMREEEALAHAVYAASATRWPSLPIFSNIAASEATHTSAVKTLLDRYELADPLAGLVTGRFKTAAFQDLYADLVAASSLSLVEALKVGVQIEELDIHDLVSQQAGIDNADIRLVYGQLLRGSRNHLRAYMQTLVQQGGTYVPQYLSQAEFDAIVNSAMETGR